MPINHDAANAEPAPPTETSWTSKDTLLYAVGVGAGSIDPGFELEYTTENSTDTRQRVLPTFAVIVGMGGGAMAAIGSFNHAMLVHGEQAIELHGEIPVAGTVLTSGRVIGVYDKGSAAVVTTESTSVDKATGQPLFTTRMSAFIRGEGGWGGDRGPSGAKRVAPERAPTTSSRTPRGRIRPSPTGSPATATRCTPTPSSPSSPGSPSPSSTDCAPTASPAARCSTRCADPIRRASRAWRPASPSPSTRATSSP